MASSRYQTPAIWGRNWLDTIDYPSNIFDQHFGTTRLLDRESYPPTTYRGCIFCPRTRAAVQLSGEPVVKNEKNKFQVMLSVSNFKPNELDVKVVDNYVLVHGKHEEKSDEHGFIQREFTRRYELPEGIEAEDVKSLLSDDGVLTIEALKREIESAASNERIVPILLSSEASETASREAPRDASSTVHNV